MSNLTLEDWARAGAHLKAVRDAYHQQIEIPGVMPLLGLDEIALVEARYNQGERTEELYEEIMALNY